MFRNCPSSRHVRVATCSIVPVMLLACSSDLQRPVAATKPDSSVVDSTIARSLLARNAYAWVGAAHNKAIEATQRAYADRRMSGTNACREIPWHLVIAATPTERIIDGSRRQDLDAHAAAGLVVSRCAPPGGASSLTPGRALSSPASAVEAALNAAVDAASSPGELAVALVPVVAQAGALAEPERSVMLAAASVAEYSFSYWHANWPSFLDAVSDQYGPCLAAGRPFDECSGGLDRRPAGVTVTTARAVTSCPSVPFLKFVRDLGKGDLAGAIVGGFSALLRTGPQSVGLGAFVGGAAGSLGVALSYAFDQSLCELDK